MQPFLPQKIFIDQKVVGLPLTQRVLSYFNHVPVEFIENTDLFKKPLPHSEAKKILLVTSHKGEVLKTCQGLGDYVCCNYRTITLVSNCHFECTYCILQDYLKNNPVMTIYANVDEILAEVKTQALSNPETLFRIGTGELSDSLALDSITQFSRDLIPFAASLDNVILELKTKSNQVQNLLDLNHKRKTVIAWSINPPDYAKEEELKCASIEERLNAARLVSDHGYPIAFHLDPLLAFPDWKTQYTGLVELLKKKFLGPEIAWFSLGSLRYTPHLQKIIPERFPKSRLLTGELFPTDDGKIRYFREIREELYHFVKNLLDEAFGDVPSYLCMETEKVWKRVMKTVPENTGVLEQKIVSHFYV